MNGWRLGNFGKKLRTFLKPLGNRAGSLRLFFPTLCVLGLGFFIKNDSSILVSSVNSYHPSCKWIYEEHQGGYEPVANNGRRDLAEFVCPSMFRDISDYVYQWPYEHFGEHRVWVADPELAAQNLPPVGTIVVGEVEDEF